MIYQIFYNEKSKGHVSTIPGLVTPFGVHEGKLLPREPGYLYDDECQPNLTEHNTLCEWRVMYYVWKHRPSSWVGFTSWTHDEKGFSPQLKLLTPEWIDRTLQQQDIFGFGVRTPAEFMLPGLKDKLTANLKNQFVQWRMAELNHSAHMHDHRDMPMGKYHDAKYWDYVMNEFKSLYSVDLERELDWNSLAEVRHLHTWCNAFISKWDYFDQYMQVFSPLVLSMLDRFGSHQTDLELSYICERLLMIFNYLHHSELVPPTKQ